MATDPEQTTSSLSLASRYADFNSQEENRFYASATVTWAADEIPGEAINPANVPPNFVSPQWYEERYPLENWSEGSHLFIKTKLNPPIDLVMIEFFAPPLTKSGPPLHLVRVGFSEPVLRRVRGGDDFAW